MKSVREAPIHPKPDYLKVFWWLFGLTLIEVGISFIPATILTRGMSVACLIALAFSKAGLVAAYYMHLKFEGWLLYAVCAPPLLLVTMLFFGLLPDIAYRIGARTRADPVAKHSATIQPGAKDPRR